MDREKFNIFDFSDKKILWSFFIAAAILYTPLLIWNEWPQRDVAFRYAPMAEAFARGDFLYAFHPRCQMLLPLCSGVVCVLTGVSGFTACKICAMIFFLLAVFPLFSLAKAIFGRKTAIGAVALYLFCFHIIDELVVAGGRDALKSFFLLWMCREFIMVYFERDSRRHYVMLGLACGLSVCVRAEMFFISAAVVFLCGVLDGLKKRFPRRSLLCLACAVAGLSVEVLTNLAVSGCAAPCGRFAALFRSIFGTDPTLAKFYLCAVLPVVPCYLAVCGATVFMLGSPLRKKLLAAAASLAAVAALVCIIRRTPFGSAHEIAFFFRGIHNGCAPVFYPPALLGILAILWKRRWNAAQGWLLSLFMLFDLLVLGQILVHDRCYYVSSRYLLPSVPLILPWSAVGIATLWELLKFFRVPFPRVIAATAIVFAIGLSIYLAYRTEILNHRRAKELNDWQTIQGLKRQLSLRKKFFIKPTPDLSYYKGNVGPAVFAHRANYYSLSVYLAGFSLAKTADEADLIITPEEVGANGIRRDFGFDRPLRETGSPVPSRHGNIVILEVVR